MAQSLALSKWYMVMSLVASLVAIGGSPSARVHQKSDLLRAPNCRTVQSAIWASCLLLCSTCVLQLMPPASIWEPLWEPLMGARERAPTYNLANTHTLRTGEYSHGDRMEALPVPVVLRLNRGGRKSSRAICNCSRCAAAPQASRLIIHRSCWSIASCTKRWRRRLYRETRVVKLNLKSSEGLFLRRWLQPDIVYARRK